MLCFIRYLDADADGHISLLDLLTTLQRPINPLQQSAPQPETAAAQDGEPDAEPKLQGGARGKVKGALAAKVAA
eukprot:1529130-Prymnesium_polylepis.1